MAKGRQTTRKKRNPQAQFAGSGPVNHNPCCKCINKKPPQKTPARHPAAMYCAGCTTQR